MLEGESLSRSAVRRRSSAGPRGVTVLSGCGEPVDSARSNPRLFRLQSTAIWPVSSLRVMAKLIYATNVSLDGYIEDETGSFDWTAPDDELFAFITDLVRPIGTHLSGRR